MREGAEKHTGRRKGRSRLLVGLLSLATAVGLVGVTAGEAGARINDTPLFKEYRINSCGMPNFTSGPWKNKSAGVADGVKVRTWKKQGNYKTVILLDGMRAEYGYSGWEINTNVQKLVNAGVNVVQPVGGPASFYADWDAPSNFNAQPFTYKWRCVITRSLIRTLDANGFRVGNGKYAIMGLSSGGGAALTIAAQNRQNFDRAASLSGYNWMTAPGMRTAIRLSMLDISPSPFNVDSMFGPPWSPRWRSNDAAWNIQGLRGMKVYVGSGNGIVGQHSFDGGSSSMSLFNDVFKGAPLELLSFTQTKAFELFANLNGVPVMSSYAMGTHSWGYWQDMVWDAKNRGFFR